MRDRATVRINGVEHDLLGFTIGVDPGRTGPTLLTAWDAAARRVVAAVTVDAHRMAVEREQQLYRLEELLLTQTMQAGPAEHSQDAVGYLMTGVLADAANAAPSGVAWQPVDSTGDPWAGLRTRPTTPPPRRRRWRAWMVQWTVRARDAAQPHQERLARWLVGRSLDRLERGPSILAAVVYAAVDEDGRRWIQPPPYRVSPPWLVDWHLAHTETRRTWRTLPGLTWDLHRRRRADADGWADLRRENAALIAEIEAEVAAEGGWDYEAPPVTTTIHIPEVSDATPR